MGTIVGIYSIKGGVGKTAAAVNLSALSALEGYKTLLCDLDPQGSATFFFRKARGRKTSVKRMIKGKSSLEELAEETGFEHLHLVPSDLAFRKMDIVLNSMKKSKSRLAGLLEPARKSYGWIFLDCPPSISLVSENVFHAVDILLIPLIPTPLSLRTYGELVDFFERQGLKTSLIVPFFSMVEGRKKLHRESMERLRRKVDRVCSSVIPYLSDVERMSVRMKPLVAYSPSSPAAGAFLGLWNEIKGLEGK